MVVVSWCDREISEPINTSIHQYHHYAPALAVDPLVVHRRVEVRDALQVHVLVGGESLLEVSPPAPKPRVADDAEPWRPE